MMKINVRVQPRSSNRKIDVLPGGSLKVYVGSPAAEGRANKEMLELLSKHFKMPKTTIKIVSGHNARDKVIELP